MATMCGCRRGANIIIAMPTPWSSLSKAVTTRSSNRFMSTRRYTSRLPRNQCQSLSPSVLSLSSHTRSYHSRFHAPLPSHEYTNSQTAILSAALKHIPEHGFTKSALILGARDMGFLDVSIQLFSRQEMDLVLYWLASRRGLLRAKVQNGLFEGKRLSVDEKTKLLVLERLRMNSKIVHRWQEVSSSLSGYSIVDFIRYCMLRMRQILIGTSTHGIPNEYSSFAFRIAFSFLRYSLSRR